MKIKQSFYIEKSDLPKMKKRLASLGFFGQGYLSRFLEKVVTEKILFINGDEIKLVITKEDKK